MHHRIKWIVEIAVAAVFIGAVGLWFGQLAFTQAENQVAICHVPPGLGKKVDGIDPPVDTTEEQAALADIANLIFVSPESEANHVPGHPFDYLALATVQTPSAKADYTCDPA